MPTLHQLLLLGKSGSGKSVAVSQARGDGFISNHVNTYSPAQMMSTGGHTNVLVWEDRVGTVGEELKLLERNNIHACAIFVDLTQHNTLDTIKTEVDQWLGLIKAHRSTPPLMYIVGSKADLLTKDALAEATECLRFVAWQAKVLAFVSSAWNNTSQLLGELRSDDKTLDSVLMGPVYLTSANAWLFKECLTPKVAGRLIDMSVQEINHTALIDALTESGNLQSFSSVRSWLPKGSDSIIQLNRLAQSAEKNGLYGMSILSCLTDSQKAHLYRWLADGCPAFDAKDFSAQAVIARVCATLLLKQAPSHSDAPAVSGLPVASTQPLTQPGVHQPALSGVVQPNEWVDSKIV